MLLSAFNFAVFTAELLTMFSYCRNIFYYRVNKLTSSLLAISGYFFLFAINYAFNNNMLINLAFFTVVNIVVMVRGFKCSIGSAAFHTTVLVAVMGTTEMLSILFISRILHLDISHYSENVVTYIIDGIICKTLFFVICRTISSFSPKEKLNKLSGKSWYLFVMPITSIFILIVLRYFADLFELPQSLIILFSISGALLMICTIIVYFVYENIQRDSQKIHELEMEKQKEKIDKVYFEVLDNQVSEMKILVHDIKNHLGTIKSISDDPAVSEYVDSIYSDFVKYSKMGQSGNKILDLVISKYTSLCSVNEISFTANTHSSNLKLLDETDASTLLNNLLDNAVEAASNSEKKYIELAVFNKDPFYVLTVINSCSAPPKIKKFDLITSKSDISLHGYGTKSIKKIAYKYGGDFSWYYDEVARNFHATVMIPYEKNNC